MMSDVEQQSDGAGDRRRYFRIDDDVSLNFSVVPKEELAARLEQLELEFSGNFTIMSSLAAINQRMAGVMHRIEADSPDVAEYLKALNHKVSVIGRALLDLDSDVSHRQAQSVNLSATGIAFHAREGPEMGSILELKLLLLPSYTGILTYGELVGCGQVAEEDPEFPHQMRVNFSHMREADRDVLIRHVIQRQTVELRKAREAREEEEY
jgi:c-di-GMP-binding flagellar brake protein YcgR